MRCSLQRLKMMFFLWLPVAGQAQQFFDHTTKAENISTFRTWIDHPSLNNNPDAVLLVTRNGSTATHPELGVWYTPQKKWAIFYIDQTRMEVNTSFRVEFYPRPDSSMFIHETAFENLRKDGKYSFIDHPALNNNPNASFRYIEWWSSVKGNLFNGVPVQFIYNDSAKKWTVGNKNGTPISKYYAYSIVLDRGYANIKPGEVKPVDPNKPGTRNPPAGKDTTITVKYSPGGKDTVLTVKNPGPGKSDTTVKSPTKDPVEKPNILTDKPTVVNVIKDVDFDNWDFEKNDIEGWTAIGPAFQHAVYKDRVLSQRMLSKMNYSNGGVGGNYWQDMSYNIGHHGNHWVGSYENRPLRPDGFSDGDLDTGELVSPEFLVTKKWCDFLIGGGSTPNLAVILQVKTLTGWSNEIARTPFRNSEQLYRTEFNMQPYLGKVARIRITDYATHAWGHLNADHFRFLDSIPESIVIKDAATGVSYRLDPNTPVWGFADTHAHPAHHIGFGGKLIAGNPDAPMDQTFSSSGCKSLHQNPAMPGTNSLFVVAADPHRMEGWPDFLGFPKFNSKTHQQQHVEFLKRAWQGGLRLYVALAVNNMYIPTRPIGPGNNGQPLDDESVMLRQVDFIKQMASNHKDWMEIAYTPMDARRIIHEGKMAVVLGVEVDNFGNFKSSTYCWQDNSRDKPMVTLHPGNAESLLEQKLNEYYSIGIRQVTPIHYISGVFGGAAVFRAETGLVQFAFNNSVNVKGGWNRRVGYNLKADFGLSAMVSALLGGGLLESDYNAKVNRQGPDADISVVNADGLTPIGQSLITKMMNRGMLIDCEHLSADAKDQLFTMAIGRNGYPVLSSHTDPQELSYMSGHLVAFEKDKHSINYGNFGTTTLRHVAHEGQMSDNHIKKIKETEGTVGVLMLPYRKKAYVGFGVSKVVNDCAGSSKTWAQMYLQCVSLMGGRGVALSTDRGMVDFIGPRFGVNASFSLREEQTDELKNIVRTGERYSQKNGVKYDRDCGSYAGTLFDNGGVQWWEEDAWKALAAWEAGINESKIEPGWEPFHGERVLNYVRGLRAVDANALLKPAVGTGDAPWEQASMYCLANNVDPSSLPGYNAASRQKIVEFYGKLKPVMDLWRAKSGDNPPVRRYKTGNRDWDFNLDGMAHYGLMPDFLQDLRNIGIKPDQMSALFRSAEDYIRMWEKAERLKAK